MTQAHLGQYIHHKQAGQDALPVQNTILGCTFFGDHPPSLGLPFGTSLGRVSFCSNLILFGQLWFVLL